MTASRKLLRLKTALAGGCAGVCALTSAANAQDPEETAPRKLLAVAAEENWSFLADASHHTDPFDAIKYIALGNGDAYASIGGEARAFYESFTNEDFGSFAGSSHYGESRLLLHAEVHPDANLRVFAELQSSDLTDRPGGPRPSIDKDVLDLLEGFVEWRSSSEDEVLAASDLAVRVGRQELDFGAGRVFSSRAGLTGEGPNVLQGMDVARVTWRTGPWRLDVFGGRPVQNKTGVFDDVEAPSQSVWGAYLTHGGLEGARTPTVDLYYFGTERPDAVFYPASGYEHRHTVGARVSEVGAPYDYDCETYYQLGEVGARSIRAAGIALQAGWTFENIPGAPRLGVLAGVNTGGGSAETVRTFSPPFPRGAYFGNLRAIGPENTGAEELSLDLHPSKAVTLSAGTFAFWRTSLHDGIYTLSGAEVAPPVGKSRFVGWQPVVSARWQLTSHFSLSVAEEIFRLGAFLEQRPHLKPIDYTAAWILFRF